MINNHNIDVYATLSIHLKTWDGKLHRKELTLQIDKKSSRPWFCTFRDVAPEAIACYIDVTDVKEYA